MEWQPIETAPKDGTDIIVFCNHGGIPIVNTGFFESGEEYKSIFGWYARVRGSESKLLDGMCEPTHWMPLPESCVHQFVPPSSIGMYPGGKLVSIWECKLCGKRMEAEGYIES